MVKKHKSIIIYLAGMIFLAMLTLSCKEEEPTITKDYVINPNWDEISNSFSVSRMKLKDTTDNIDYKNVSPSELLRKLEEDTSYSFVTNVGYNGENYSKRKVYFDKFNGFYWSKPPDIDTLRNSRFETIDKLQKDTWYLLGGLSNVKTLYYVYVDSLNNLHCYKVGASQWTNI